jgi:hypothetical protein
MIANKRVIIRFVYVLSKKAVTSEATMKSATKVEIVYFRFVFQHECLCFSPPSAFS